MPKNNSFFEREMRNRAKVERMRNKMNGKPDYNSISQPMNRQMNPMNRPINTGTRPNVSTMPRPSKISNPNLSNQTDMNLNPQQMDVLKRMLTGLK